MALLINMLYVGAGGFIGSILRYLIGLVFGGNASGFPFATLFINVVGALCVGFFTAYFVRFFAPDHELLLFLRVGLCGGFTTFSAFSLETVNLIQNGDLVMAAFYVGLSVILCVGAVFLGEGLASFFPVSHI